MQNINKGTVFLKLRIRACFVNNYERKGRRKKHSPPCEQNIILTGILSGNFYIIYTGYVNLYYNEITIECSLNMFDLGTQELIVIFIVAFLVFGPKKLPELGRTLGKGMRELKSAMRGVRESIEEAGEDVTEEIRDVHSELKDSVQKSLESQFDFKGGVNKGVSEKDQRDKEAETAAEEEKEKSESDKDG